MIETISAGVASININCPKCHLPLYLNIGSDVGYCITCGYTQKIENFKEEIY